MAKEDTEIRVTKMIPLELNKPGVLEREVLESAQEVFSRYNAGNYRMVYNQLILSVSIVVEEIPSDIGS